MNSLKIGIIGIFILLPFLFLSFVQVQHREAAQKSRTIVEKAAERAMRDGVFALKTYSRFSYDTDQSKKIVIAEKETIECINRSFAYALNAKTEDAVAALQNDIRLIGFVSYDSLILHDQKTKERLEIPFAAAEINGSEIRVKSQTVQDKKNMDKSTSRTIEQMLESILQPYVGADPLILPEHRSVLFGNDYSEVGVLMIVKGDPLQIGEERDYFKIGKVSLSQRKGLESEETTDSAADSQKMP